MRRKRGLALLCLLACLLSIPANAYAANFDAASEQSVIMPRMTYIRDADCYFSIWNGVASVDAYVQGDPSMATKCEITVELQEKAFLFWNVVEVWSDVQEGRRAGVNASIEVAEGNRYRTVTTVTVWSGTQSETKTLTSETIEA